MKVYTGKPDSKRKLAHQMPRKTAKKHTFKCVGGPYDGKTLFLTDGVTAVFTVGGNKGRYNNGEWQQC